MDDARGKRVPLADAIRQEFSNVVAVDASVAKGRAYLACRDSDGSVRPMFLWLARFDMSGDAVMYKHMSLEESPTRWPAAVAEALTTWEP